MRHIGNVECLRRAATLGDAVRQRSCQCCEATPCADPRKEMLAVRSVRLSCVSAFAKLDVCLVAVRFVFVGAVVGAMALVRVGSEHI